jgi:hypothetical protein
LQTWWAEVLSKSGKCFGIEDKSGAGGGTFYAGTTTATCGGVSGTGCRPELPDAELVNESSLTTGRRVPTGARRLAS